MSRSFTKWATLAAASLWWSEAAAQAEGEALPAEGSPAAPAVPMESATPATPVGAQDRPQGQGAPTAPPRGAGAAVSAPLETGRGLSEAEALRLAFEHNPSLAVNGLTRDQAAEQIRLAEGRYSTIMQLDGGYTHTEAPSIGATGSVGVATSDSVTAGAELRRTFPAGTTVSVRTEGERFDTRRPGGVGLGDSTASASSTGYQVAARAALTQPLLRGYGRQVGLTELNVARLNHTVAEGSLVEARSALARDVLGAYWEAWYAERAVAIEVAAKELAIQQLDEARRRQAAGSLAPADVFPFETRVASLHESLVLARLTEQQRRLELGQLLGVSTPASPDKTTIPPKMSWSLTDDALVREAVERSPELAPLQASVRVAEARAAVAADPYRARLDLETYVEAGGLGNQRLPPAYEQLGRLDAVSGHVGLVYETPLNRRQRQAAQAAADLDVRIAKQQLVVVRQRLESSARSLIASVRAAEARLEAARMTVEVAERQFKAERSRFELGTSTPIQVQEAEDQVRQARLRVVSAEVDAAIAGIQLDYFRGTLLARRGG